MTGLAAAEPPWATHSMPSQPAMPAQSTGSAEDRQLKSLMTALRKHTDSLPQELQTLMNSVAQKENQNETKQLHSAVTAHGKAKKELQAAQMARYNLHASWRTFLTNAVNLWQGYSTQFQEQDQKMMERVSAATAALQEAKANLANTKTLAGVEQKEDLQPASDDEMDKDKDIAGQTSQRIQEGIQNLHNSLKQVQSSADQMVEEEQKAIKRPRLEHNKEANADMANAEDGGFR